MAGSGALLPAHLGPEAGGIRFAFSSNTKVGRLSGPQGPLGDWIGTSPVATVGKEVHTVSVVECMRKWF